MKIKQIFIPSDPKNSSVDSSYFYLLINEDSKQALAFDPGLYEPINNYLEENNLHLAAILNTHHHPDHVGGNLLLQKKYNCPIYSSAYDKKRVPGVTHTVAPGDHLQLTNNDIQVIDLKAHTMGLVGFYIPTLKALFPGDAIFSAGCGRLFEGNGHDLYQSFKTIKELPSDTLIYCSHEYTEANIKFAKHIDPNNVELIAYSEKVKELREQELPTIPCLLETELKINPFFQVFNSDFMQANNFSDPAKAIAQLRRLKDQF